MRKPPPGLTIVLLLGACGHGGSSSPPSPAAERIEIVGSGNLGIFDPAITRDPGSRRPAMSCSSVDSSIYYPASTYWAVSIRLACSDDKVAAGPTPVSRRPSSRLWPGR
ncbi:MAG: hypothetical protein OEO19_13735 [Gammaproteobacteria bacterium]|nr:hypothetical protein [Gammaproteobacteria bacterium]MDH3446953.1 hypothetical protein [Gammaproteobacteria bacterium]